MMQSLNQEGSTSSAAPADDCTRSALSYVHELLADSAGGSATWTERLGKLTAAFRAQRAGRTDLASEALSAPQRSGPAERQTQSGGRPWEAMPDLLKRLRDGVPPQALRTAERSFLLTASAPAESGRWLFWLEDVPGREWSAGEQAAFAVAATALARTAPPEANPVEWARWQEQARLQQRLEDAAVVVARLSHDFGNVLTGIMGFTELGLAQLTPGSPAFQRIQEVFHAAEQGVHLISRLHGISQRSPRSSRPTFLAAVVAEEASRLRTAWGTGVTLHVAVSADLPPVAVDLASLRQILIALLDNARQAIDGAGTVTLRAERFEATVAECLDVLGDLAPGPCVRLTVTDTGPGFSADARRRVFAEPFYSSKPRHRGMGLAGVYGQMRVYGGGLRLAHPKAGGAEVQVYLPLAARTAQAVLAPRARDGAARVLIVEDDATVRRLIRNTLDQAGYEVHTATDGVEALEVCKAVAEPFDLVLADVVMPRMDGFELARRLLERDPAANILFASGHVPPGFDQEVFGGRTFDLVTKPFPPGGLVRAVKNALGRDLNSRRVAG